MKKLALLGLAVCILPLSACAAPLVNINTADATLLETLPGIGPSKAAAIIEYRSVHGLFATVASIQDVSGIGPSTYANIQPLITVGGSSVPSAAAGDDSPAPSSSASDSRSTSSAAPAGGTLTVQIGRARTVTLGTAVALSATVSLGGHADSAASVSWSFGDGSSASGRSVAKAYRYAGTYAIHATASDGGATGEADTTLTVVPAELRIAAVTGQGILLANSASSSVDISGWQLTAGMGRFSLPSGMILLGSASILLPQEVTGLPVAYDAKLYTAEGQLAAAYELPVVVPALRSLPALQSLGGAGGEEVQPSALVGGSYQEQNVESAGVISVSKTAHGTQAVSAPAAPTEVAAAGAARLGAPEAEAAGAAPTIPLRARLTRTLESPWALGVLGLLVFSGGALIVL